MLRDFHALELERSKVVFFPSLWTIVHLITDTSPFYGFSEQEVLKKDVEYMAMIKAFDESFPQTVYSRPSYKAEVIRWGEEFIYVVEHDGNGVSTDVSSINETYGVDLN